MRLFGFDVRIHRRVKATTSGLSSPTTSRAGWWPIVSIVRESSSGSWQRGIEGRTQDVLGFSAVYACVTLIASDIGKLRLKLVQQNASGIWDETSSPSFSPVMKKPNHFQTRIKFIEQWMTSKLIHGNAYILKQRDNRRVVIGMYVLDPQRVRPLVAPNQDVYYALSEDNLAGIEASDVVVPASEIIHDVMVPLYHPLCGVSPIYACGLAALQGLSVQNHSASFFDNGAQPSGVLTAPGVISPETATRIREHWESNYGGSNSGRVAVLGDDLKYQAMSMNATDSQLIEQLKWTAEDVCRAFHVPPYMIGVGSMPTYNNIEALNQQYYAQCLQTHIESIELLVDEGIGLTRQTPEMGSEFDLDDLLRMDTATRVKAASDSVGSGCVSPNEARARYFGLGPVPGGETPYMQEQNWPLRQLNARELPSDRPPTQPEPTPNAERLFVAALRKELGMVCDRV